MHFPFSCVGFKWVRFASTVFWRSVIVWHFTQPAKLGEGAGGSHSYRTCGVIGGRMIAERAHCSQSSGTLRLYARQ